MTVNEKDPFPGPSFPGNIPYRGSKAVTVMGTLTSVDNKSEITSVIKCISETEQPGKTIKQYQNLYKMWVISKDLGDFHFMRLDIDVVHFAGVISEAEGFIDSGQWNSKRSELWPSSPSSL